MNRSAIITGAGSGVGQAVALSLARDGWRLALVGRRLETLEQTRTLAGSAAGPITLCPCDVGDRDAVQACAGGLLREWGTLDALINAAGTNAPRRSLAELSPADYQSMINTNLHGAYYWVEAVLPTMRVQRRGTIVNVVSDAGKLASPKAGPAYVMSKFGLAGLNQSINAEERGNGIRACAIFPGDIDTPLLEKRPAPPNAEARSKMLHAGDVAACVRLCLDLPDRAIVEELVIRPR